MKISLVVLMIFLITACAITPDRARTMLDSELCNKYGRLINSSEADKVIANEIRYRGVDCSPYFQQRNYDMQQGLQLMDMGIRTMTAPVPQPSKPVNCITNCVTPYNCTTTCY